MTLRRKTLIMIGVTLLSLVIFLFAVSQVFLITELNSMEEKTASQDVMRANNSIHQEMINLNATVQDWATWDDTYSFMMDNNSQYIQSNMVDSTFKGLNLDLILFIDSSGKVTYVKSWSNNTFQSAVPGGMQTYISSSGVLNLKTNENTVTGIINTSNGPMIVSAHPILTSNGQGPSHGTLIMGRYLDAEEFKTISNNVQLAIQTLPIVSQGTGNKYSSIFDSLKQKSVFINSSNPDTIFAYTMLYDLHEKPVLIIETSNSRAIHNDLKDSLYYFLIIMISAGIIMGLSILIYLDRAVLLRLDRINQGVRKIGKSKNFSARVEVLGDDELADLTISINRMMGKLENSHNILQNSEEKFRQLAENMEEVFWMVDAHTGQFIYISPSYEGAWGRNVQELYQNPKNWLEHIHPLDKEIARVFFSERCGVKLDESSGIEYRIIRPDDSLRWIGAKLSPIEDEHGEVIRIAGIAEDITKRKLAEEELVHTKNRLSFVLSATPAVIYTSNYKEPYETTFISENVYNQLGYSPQEIINQPGFWLDRIHPEDKIKLRDSMETLWARGKSSSEYRFLNSEGDYRWLMDDANLIRAEDGKPKEIAGFWIDITKRKDAEIAQKQSESVYQTIFENTGTAIVMVEEDMTLSLVNDEFQLLFNFRKEEIEGKKKFYELTIPEESERVMNYHILLRKSPSSVPNSYETKFLDNNGDVRDVVVTMDLIPETKRSVVSIVDVTEHKAADNKIRSSLKEKEVLLQEIHHRVKNNLQVISSLLSLQSRYIKDKEVLELFKESQNRVKSMTLVHEKLYQSHDVSQVDFKDYLGELARILFRSYGISSDKVSLILDVEDVSVDVNMAIPCGLIITELVTNSLKYAFPSGNKGIIKISFKKRNSNYILEVEDDGVGIPESIDLEKSKSLGLRLVRTLTDQLGGQVEMNVREGTKFKITFG